MECRDELAYFRSRRRQSEGFEAHRVRLGDPVCNAGAAGKSGQLAKPAGAHRLSVPDRRHL
jgi:hypothetical protein